MLNAATNPLLNSILIGLFISAGFAGFCFWFYGIYWFFRFVGPLMRLKEAVRQMSPEIYQRVFERNASNGFGAFFQWRLFQFIKNTELDDIPQVFEKKQLCRHSSRGLKLGFLGFIASWIFGALIGMIAVTLGSPSIH